jgi:hypothetical protein
MPMRVPYLSMAVRAALARLLNMRRISAEEPVKVKRCRSCSHSGELGVAYFSRSIGKRAAAPGGAFSASACACLSVANCCGERSLAASCSTVL